MGVGNRGAGRGVGGNRTEAEVGKGRGVALYIRNVSHTTPSQSNASLSPCLIP